MEGFARFTLDQDRAKLERCYGKITHAESYALYHKYVNDLLDYYEKKGTASPSTVAAATVRREEETGGIVVGDGSPPMMDVTPKAESWRSYAWINTNAPFLEFEVCISLFCRASYRYGMVKAWITEKSLEARLDLDLEDMLFERLEDAFGLSSSSSSRKTRITDDSFSYYDNTTGTKPGGGRPRRVLFTEKEKEELKTQISFLQEAAATFLHVASKRLPSYRQDDFLFSDLSAAVPTTTVAWSEDFLGNCDKLTCQKLYGVCAITSSMLMYILLSDLYDSPPPSPTFVVAAAAQSQKAVPSTWMDLKKSKVLLDYARYSLKYAKCLPVTLPDMEDKLTVLNVLCYARYCYDLEFRCKGRPLDFGNVIGPNDVGSGGGGGNAIFDPYRPYKKLAPVLSVLADITNAIYSRRSESPHVSVPNRHREILDQIDRYYSNVMNMPSVLERWRIRGGGGGDWTPSVVDTGTESGLGWLDPQDHPVFSQEVMHLVGNVIPSVCSGTQSLGTKMDVYTATNSSDIARTGRVYLVPMSGDVRSLPPSSSSSSSSANNADLKELIYRMGILSMLNDGGNDPPKGWTESSMLRDLLTRTMRDAGATDFKVFYRYTVLEFMYKEQASFKKDKDEGRVRASALYV